MAMCDYYLCDVCGQKCFYDAAIAEYDDDNNYLLSGSKVDIAAICESCAKTYQCVVVGRNRGGVGLISAERARQKAKEGYSDEHDDLHDKFEMTLSAIAYALHATDDTGQRWDEFWPFGACEWKPSDPVRDLVKAAALIAAEIDRIQRIQAGSGNDATKEHADATHRSEAP